MEVTERNRQQERLRHHTEERLRGAEVALERAAERIAEDESTVELLQQAILPDLPRIADPTLSGRYLPAGAKARVGGDWYDAFVHGDGRVGLVIGDVAGHGLSAASVMSQVRHSLRAYADLGLPPTDTMRFLNRLLYADDHGDFVTCIYAVYDPHDRSLVWCRAGHPPAVVFDGQRRHRVLVEPASPPLGALRDPTYRAAATTLTDDETLVLFTDGLVERPGEHPDVGLARLVAACRRLDPAASDLGRALSDAMMADWHPLDDVCVLTARPTAAVSLARPADRELVQPT